MNPRPRGTTAAAAFTRLLEMLRPDLLRFAFWLARDRAVAEDVVQETLIRAWKSREELKDPAAARPWLFTIVRREHARLYERKRLPTVDVDDVEALGDPALASDGDAGLHDLRRAIMQLPDEYREPLVLQVLGGFTTAEIAAELGLTQAAVLTRLFRARNRLRVIYGLAARGGRGMSAADRLPPRAPAHRRRPARSAARGDARTSPPAPSAADSATRRWRSTAGCAPRSNCRCTRFRKPAPRAGAALRAGRIGGARAAGRRRLLAVPVRSPRWRARSSNT